MPPRFGPCCWEELPVHILTKIFSLLPSRRTVSRVCAEWRRAAFVMANAQPVLWRPVTDGFTVDVPVEMEILVPTTVRPRGSVLHRNMFEEGTLCFYRYLSLASPSIDAALRFIGGTTGVPLFVNDNRSHLEVRRLIALPGGTGSSAEGTVFTIALPEGIEPTDAYLASVAVSSSHTGSTNGLPCAITSILLVTTSALFGINVDHHDALTCSTPRWSRVRITEPLQGPSLEAGGQRRTFVSILQEKDGDGNAGAGYYLLDASWRLALIRLNSTPGGTELRLQELPMANNMLLGLNVKKAWLLYLPRWDHLGDDVVCLTFRDLGRYGTCFDAFNFVDEGAYRRWEGRISVGGGYCVFLGWGPGAEAFGCQWPLRMGLQRGQIYNCRRDLMSYRLGWRCHPDVYNVLPPESSLVWPFPLWIDPVFPASVALEGVASDEEVLEDAVALGEDDA